MTLGTEKTHGPVTTQLNPQNRLRTMVKQLVIELGYLELCLDQDLQAPNIRTAATSLDTAIDCLNEYLSTE